MNLAGDLQVKPFPRDQSVHFLLNRTRQADAVAAGKLAEALGDLPLALEQAGAYIRLAEIVDLDGYLQRFTKYRTAALSDEETSPDNLPHTVATSWEVSLQAVAQESPAAADLLHLCAFLAPEAIPLDVLRRYCDQLPGVLQTALADDLDCDEMLALLQRYSLLEVTPDTLAIHRLVQAVIRDRLDEEHQKLWAGAAVQLVNAAFPGDVTTNPESWLICDRLLPHALAAAGHAETLQVGLEAAGRLLNQAGLYLKDRAAYAAAQAASARALAITEKVFGPNHPKVAIRLNNLAQLLQDTGRLAEAEPLMRRALEIDEHSFGTEHPNVAIRSQQPGRLAPGHQSTGRGRATHAPSPGD